MHQSLTLGLDQPSSDLNINFTLSIKNISMTTALAYHLLFPPCFLEYMSRMFYYSCKAASHDSSVQGFLWIPKEFSNFARHFPIYLDHQKVMANQQTARSHQFDVFVGRSHSQQAAHDSAVWTCRDVQQHQIQVVVGSKNSFK